MAQLVSWHYSTQVREGGLGMRRGCLADFFETQNNVVEVFSYHTLVNLKLSAFLPKKKRLVGGWAIRAKNICSSDFKNLPNHKHRKCNQWKKFLEANPQSTDLKCEPFLQLLFGSVEDVCFRKGSWSWLKDSFSIGLPWSYWKKNTFETIRNDVQVECRILFPPPRLASEMALIPQSHHNDPPKSCHVQQIHLKKQKIYTLPPIIMEVKNGPLQ